MVRAALVCCLCMALCGAGWTQPLDWAGDMTIFGTEQNERAPRLLGLPGGNTLRALCVCGDSLIAMKLSRNAGLSWSAADNLPSPYPLPLLASAVDATFHYVLLAAHGQAPIALYRLPPAAQTWTEAASTPVAPDRALPVESIQLMSDHLFQPADPYVNLCWIEREPENLNWSLRFAQSRDRGATIDDARHVFTSNRAEPETIPLAMTASWRGEDERLWIAAPVDRPGSIPEQLHLFFSDDQGQSWQDAPLVDASSWSQNEHALAALDTTILVAYARGGAALRDIYLAVSIDGGDTFDLPEAAAADPLLDEYAPRLAIDPGAGTFDLFFTADSGAHDRATLYVRSGSLRSPHALSPALAVSEPGTVIGEQGVSVAAGGDGVCAAWTSSFALGDTDIRYDASWRGSAINDRSPPVPSAISLSTPYPNPFNGTVVMSLLVSRPLPVTLRVTDSLGRQVFRRNLGTIPTGAHPLSLDLSHYPAGIYWVSLPDKAVTPQKVVLIR